MMEIIAKVIAPQIAANVAGKVVKHSDKVVDSALNVAADTIEFAGDCVCGILDGIGSLFDP